MRVEIPFNVVYDVENATSLEDVIQGLISIKLLIEEGGHNLPHFVPGLQVERVQVNVTAITQQSPLREILLVGIYLAVQKDLEKEVPKMIEIITGTQPPEEFKTILTLSVLIVIFYGAAYVKDLLVAAKTDNKLRKQMNAIIKDLAERTGNSEDYIKKFLDDRYMPKNRIKALAAAAFGFFRPSKAQNNSKIHINETLIDRPIIAEVPQEYAYEQIMHSENSEAHYGIELELHAQDRDRETSGWAAVPKGLSDKRIKMKLLDGVTPNELWGRNSIKGDIMIKFKRTGSEMTPTEIHLTRIHPS